MVTIEELLKDGIEIIQQREYNFPQLEAELLLSYLLNEDRLYLHLNRKTKVNEEVKERFYQLAKKRNEGYPLQYMTHVQEFMGLEFFVQEGVLIPRQDTEILVEKVIKIANEKYKNQELKILDIGTGSGDIGISLAFYLKNSKVTAIDISNKAIETANINIKKHKLDNIIAIKKDIFDDIFAGEKYHIVVSNPPYIARDVIGDLQTEVAVYEPKLALDGGSDGLDYYGRIVEVFSEIHERRGILSVEIGNKQKEAVEEIFMKSGSFKIIETDKDLSENYRLVTGMT